MAIVTENGTGKADAESYITVAAADTRHAAFGNTAWAALDTAAKESALRNATAYMLQSFRSRWTGFRVLLTQSLDWPRWQVVVDGFYIPSDAVPAEIANACADLALRASTETLAADLTRGIVREKVGPLETEFDPFSPQQTRYRAVDMMLAPYLKGSSSMATLVRA